MSGNLLPYSSQADFDSVSSPVFRTIQGGIGIGYKTLSPGGCATRAFYPGFSSWRRTPTAVSGFISPDRRVSRSQDYRTLSSVPCFSIWNGKAGKPRPR
jgi:hypothetical protein